MATEPTEHPKAIKAKIPAQVNGLLEKAHSAPQITSGPKLPSVTPLSQRNLDQLWLTMAETYGHRWTSNFGVSADQDHAWAKHLAGLTGRQIASGLNALSGMALAWPPSAPEFRELCLQVPGLPSEGQAWDEARAGIYSHPAVRVAAEATSLFDLHGASSHDRGLRQRFERNYAIVVRRVQTGQPLDGRIPHGIGTDAARPREQIQLEHSHREAEQLVAIFEIPKDPQSCRALLLDTLHIRRDEGKESARG
ncbi:hypothetical protein D3C75_825030 [compost metagenome]